ncbi:MAG: 2-C-methyl-D-erythritol 4-phosphate cytidylyltransferase [Candidatus Brocadiia bacterium]
MSDDLPPPPIALVVPAAGLGRRMGNRRKPFLELAGKPLLFHALDRFRSFRDRIVQTLLVLHAEDIPAARRTWGERLEATYGVTRILPGGARRQDSVRAALDHVSGEAGLVVIHDGVRPFVSRRAIAASLDAAEKVGAAVVASPVKPTIKRVADHRVVGTVDRRNLWGAQTPQVFRRSLILGAYQAAQREGPDVTDDAQLVEHLGRPVAIVEGSDLNLKITTAEDLRLAEALLAAGLVPQDDDRAPCHPENAARPPS